jgi:hypothetical protein
MDWERATVDLLAVDHDEPLIALAARADEDCERRIVTSALATDVAVLLSSRATSASLFARSRHQARTIFCAAAPFVVAMVFRIRGVLRSPDS